MVCRNESDQHVEEDVMFRRFAIAMSRPMEMAAILSRRSVADSGATALASSLEAALVALSAHDVGAEMHF